MRSRSTRTYYSHLSFGIQLSVDDVYTGVDLDTICASHRWCRDPKSVEIVQVGVLERYGLGRARASVASGLWKSDVNIQSAPSCGRGKRSLARNAAWAEAARAKNSTPVDHIFAEAPITERKSGARVEGYSTFCKGGVNVAVYIVGPMFREPGRGDGAG